MSTSSRGTDASDIAGTSRASGGFLLGPRSGVIIVAIAAGILLLSALLHLEAIRSSTGAWSDIYSYNIQATTVFKHLNVYTVTDRYPYPPVWIWIIALAAWFSIHAGIPFDQVAKAPATVADVAIAVVLLLYAWRRFGWCWFALIPMALFALNPVVILISAGHGQFDSLVIFFLLLAFYLRGQRQDQRIIWAALALGVAIALKGYPVLALPYFVVTAPRGARMLTLAATFAPLVASVLLYCALFGIVPQMITNVLGYQSTPDFSWGYLVSPYITSAGADTLALLLGLASKALLVLFAIIAPIRLARTRPIIALVMLFSAFYALTYTMSVQYMLWILPFLCVAFPVWSVVYSIACLFAAFGFYLQGGAGRGAIPTADPWPAVAVAFNVPREVGVIAMIAVSTAIYIHTLILASPYASAWRAWLPVRRGRSQTGSQADHANAPVSKDTNPAPE